MDSQFRAYAQLLQIEHQLVTLTAEMRVLCLSKALPLLKVLRREAARARESASTGARPSALQQFHALIEIERQVSMLNSSFESLEVANPKAFAALRKIVLERLERIQDQAYAEMAKRSPQNVRRRRPRTPRK